MSFFEVNFKNNFFMGIKRVSILNNPLSLVALLVKNIPKGIMTNAEIQEPRKEEMELSSAKFLPMVFPKK